MDVSDSDESDIDKDIDQLCDPDYFQPITSSENAQSTCAKNMKVVVSNSATEFCVSSTKDPFAPSIKTLKCPETAKAYLDHYFPSWNNINTNDHFSMPFCTDFNSAPFQSEKLLYDYCSKLNQPMLIINDYRHNTKFEQYPRGICKTDEEYAKGICMTRDETVGQIDILVVHREHGLLLFEVKDLRQIKVVENPMAQKPKKKSKLRCPLEMINDDMNGEMKQAWCKHWNMTEADIELMLDNITNETERSKRSFLCLYGWDSGKYCENGIFKVKCDRCSHLPYTGKMKVFTCQVLLQRHMESFNCFSTWWYGYFEPNHINQDLPMFEFLLNRFGLDFYLSEWIRKSTDIYIAEKIINDTTYQMKKSFIRQWTDRILMPGSTNTVSPKSVAPATTKEQCVERENRKRKKNRQKKKGKEEGKEKQQAEQPIQKQQTVPILYSIEQKKALLEAHLAFIIGPPGSGKTIIMVEKVRTLLRILGTDDDDDRILIICGNSEPLRNMLSNNSDYFKSESELCNTGKLLILTKTEFDQFDSNEENRFRHIFIDESHDMKPETLITILHRNLSKVDNNKRHFWILRDGSQNRLENRDGIIDIPLFDEYYPEWRSPLNVFTIFFLRLIFRTTQNQFLTFQPFMKITCCESCKGDKKAGKVVCNLCHPLVATKIYGPQPLFIELPNDESFSHEDIAKKVLEAIVGCWSMFIRNPSNGAKNENENDSSRNLHSELQMLLDRTDKKLDEDIIKKTAVLIRDADDVSTFSSNLKAYLNQHNVTVCQSKEFYAISEENRAKCLTVDSFENFKGLEYSVVIIVQPSLDWANLCDKDMNYYIVSLSRANCQNVIITTRKGKEDFLKLMETNYGGDSNYDAKKAVNKWRDAHTAVLPVDQKVSIFDAVRLDYQIHLDGEVGGAFT